jgi:hypothetical protein
MKLFISGSKNINCLTDKAKELLNKAINRNHSIIVGDCNGIDTVVQGYCNANNYPNVSIYHVGDKPRNHISSYETIKVGTKNGLSAYEYFQQKDIFMSNLCDIGIVFWDGTSKGSYTNITRLLEQEKPVVLHLINEDKTYTFRNKKDFLSLIKKGN